MSASARKISSARLRARIQEIKRQVQDLDLVVAGTLVRRTKVCGKAKCRCASDPAQRHGPYYEWGRIEAGRRVTSTVSAQKARRLAAALRSQRRLEGLVRRWGRESVRVLNAEPT